jgi:hypothetical protein
MRRALVACVFTVSALAVSLPASPAYASVSVHAIITKYTLAAGFGAADVTAMKQIADYESHDHPSSHSKSCWGLFQLSTKMVKGHPWSDPVWNTKRALAYVKSRYGTPRKALAHIKKSGWY